MKTIITTLIAGLMLATSAMAEPLSGAIHFVATHGAVFFAALDAEPRECDSKPNVLARHKGETSYTFEVTQCELEYNNSIEPAK